MKKYYDILGLKYNATEKEIKSVYRKLSKIYHPDMVGTGNEEMFKKVNNAYKEIEKNNFQCENCKEKKEKYYKENREEKEEKSQSKKQENYHTNKNEKDFYHNATAGIISGLFDGILNILKKIFYYPMLVAAFV